MQKPPSAFVAEADRSQRALVAWEAFVGRGSGATSLVLPEISDSWQRSLTAAVDPALQRAPLLFDADALAAARQSEWVQVAEALLAPHLESVRESGHVLTLFDARGCMLLSAGDAHTLDRLHDIHFTPGAVWSEDLVGTNGPGTALALHRPVHVIGAEHFCEAWHDWHCAAVPLLSPEGHELLGALDISGHRAGVTPYAFGMARALGQLLQQALALRARTRRAQLLEEFGALVARYPQSTVVALAPSGALVAAHPAAARSLDIDLLRRDPATSVVEPKGAGSSLGTCLIRGERRQFPERAAEPASAVGLDLAPRYRLTDLSGDHPMLVEARRLVEVASRNRLPVLLLGESGVGKEVAAQAIHSESSRAHRPFVAVNCGAIARELLESELFGYVPFAFSGANRRGAPGKFAAAQGGTLFLDEIAELPAAAQATLLRVLSEGHYTPVGGNTPSVADVRIIAATNRDLPSEIAAGRLRADLYHRLNVISIALPALRLRSADIPSLCERFLLAAARETGRQVRLAPEVMAALLRYAWPGNVRELENLLRRLSATSRNELVLTSDLPAELTTAAAAVDACGPPATASEDPNKLRLVKVISAARTMAEAAAMLGVTRSTLYRKLERFGLRPGRAVRPDETGE
jgi:sigma-54 dependent transcriptional regulator, acetoin dehydrogenase operon transcriptional activator AcoR